MGWILIKKNVINLWNNRYGSKPMDPPAPPNSLQMDVHSCSFAHIYPKIRSIVAAFDPSLSEVLTGSFTETRQHSAAHSSAILPITTPKGTTKQQRRRFQPPRGACTAPSAAVLLSAPGLPTPSSAQRAWSWLMFTANSQILSANSTYLTGLHANTHTLFIYLSIYLLIIIYVYTQL